MRRPTGAPAGRPGLAPLRGLGAPRCLGGRPFGSSGTSPEYSPRGWRQRTRRGADADREPGCRQAAPRSQPSATRRSQASTRVTPGSALRFLGTQRARRGCRRRSLSTCRSSRGSGRCSQARPPAPCRPPPRGHRGGHRARRGTSRSPCRGGSSPPRSPSRPAHPRPMPAAGGGPAGSGTAPSPQGPVARRTAHEPGTRRRRHRPSPVGYGQPRTSARAGQWRRRRMQRRRLSRLRRP